MDYADTGSWDGSLTVCRVWRGRNYAHVGVIRVLIQDISVLIQDISLPAAHVLSRVQEQPLEGGLGLSGLLPSKVHLAVHLPELLEQRARRKYTTMPPMSERAITRKNCCNSRLAQTEQGQKIFQKVAWITNGLVLPFFVAYLVSIAAKWGEQLFDDAWCVYWHAKGLYAWAGTTVSGRFSPYITFARNAPRPRTRRLQIKNYEISQTTY